jgi:hypothetical protein
LFGLSTTHSGPEWKPLPAVVWTYHLLRSSDVPSNSSSNVQTQGEPFALTGASPPQSGPPAGALVVSVGVGDELVGAGVEVEDGDEPALVGVGVGVGVELDEVGLGEGLECQRFVVMPLPIRYEAAASAVVTLAATRAPATTSPAAAMRKRWRGLILGALQVSDPAPGIDFRRCPALGRAVPRPPSRDF